MWRRNFYGQFAFSLGKESPYISSKFDPQTPLNTETFYGPSVSVLTGFDCRVICVSPDKFPFFNIHGIIFEKQSLLHNNTI